MYFAKGNQYDENSKENKKIIHMFVQREVRLCVSEFVEYVFDTATDKNAPPFTMDDVSNNGIPECPRCGSAGLEEVTLLPSMVHPFYDSSADAEEQFVCPVCMMGHPTQAEAINCCAGEIVYQCPDCQEFITADEYEDLISDCVPPVSSWWAVTDWLCEKLEEYGEVVIKNASIWGRQSEEDIEKDQVILDICKDLGILQGQEHAWVA